jgi:hypothetical protein
MPMRTQPWLTEVECVNNGHRFKTPVRHRHEKDVEEPSGRIKLVVERGATEGIYCPECGSPVEPVDPVKYV